MVRGAELVGDGRSCCVAARAAGPYGERQMSPGRFFPPLSPQLHRQEGLGITPKTWRRLQVPGHAEVGAHAGLPPWIYSCRLTYLHCSFKCGFTRLGHLFFSVFSLTGMLHVLLPDAESNPSCSPFSPARLVQLMKL